MAKWNGEYIHPYAEHGKKPEQVKKNYRFHSAECFKSINRRAYPPSGQ